ncbi:MAG: hypothetical protein V4635_18185, partial [Bacteroidota bacterium]
MSSLCFYNIFLRGAKQYIFQILGPLLAVLIWSFADLDPGNRQITLMAGVTVWMCTWWFSEAVSLAVTALVPVLMLPVLGISDCKTVSQQYTDSI